jgi:hypothetical protein
MNETVGIVAAVVFFLVLAGVAYIAFKLLRKTVKMAFRMAIVAIILVIAVAGSISFWWLGHSKPATRPTSRQTR